MRMILAVGENGELGEGDKLPWKCSQDLQYFKKQTLNEVVVMGSKTFYSLPFTNGFPKRDNIVLSRSEGCDRDSVTFLGSVESVLDYLYYFDEDIHNPWIVGGKSIYEAFAPYVDEVHCTQIEGSYPNADVFYDTKWFTDDNKWCKVSEERLADNAVVSVYKKII